MIGWQPIETAPKDGTEIIVKDSGGAVHGVAWTTGLRKVTWANKKPNKDWFTLIDKYWIPHAVYWVPMPDNKLVRTE